MVYIRNTLYDSYHSCNGLVVIALIICVFIHLWNLKFAQKTQKIDVILVKLRFLCYIVSALFILDNWYLVNAYALYYYIIFTLCDSCQIILVITNQYVTAVESFDLYDFHNVKVISCIDKCFSMRMLSKHVYWQHYDK